MKGAIVLVDFDFDNEADKKLDMLSYQFAVLLNRYDGDLQLFNQDQLNRIIDKCEELDEKLDGLISCSKLEVDVAQPVERTEYVYRSLVVLEKEILTFQNKCLVTLIGRIRKVNSMLRNNFNQGSRMWDPQGIRNNGMAPEGMFVFAGVDAEPINRWDADAGRFDDSEIEGWAYPVIQDWVNEDGELFQQNQILVAVDNPKKLKLSFGDKVRFEGLGGFYSRKSRKFKAHAEKIEKVDEKQ